MKKSRFALAMVALHKCALPEITELETKLKEFALTFSFRDFKKDGAIISFKDDEGLGFISLMSGPIPWADLEGPCATSWRWPEAAQIMRSHTHHLLVIRDDPDPIWAALKLTGIVSALCSLSECVGVYWGAAGLVHAPDAFVRECKNMSRKLLPIILWVDFRGNRNADGTMTIFTQGMEAFGHMEIEILSSKTHPLQLLGRMSNLAEYLLANGPIVKDGDTIGMPAEEKIEVRHRPSIWDENKIVYQLMV